MQKVRWPYSTENKIYYYNLVKLKGGCDRGAAGDKGEAQNLNHDDCHTIDRYGLSWSIIIDPE